MPKKIISAVLSGLHQPVNHIVQEQLAFHSPFTYIPGLYGSIYTASHSNRIVVSRINPNIHNISDCYKVVRQRHHNLNLILCCCDAMDVDDGGENHTNKDLGLALGTTTSEYFFMLHNPAVLHLMGVVVLYNVHHANLSGYLNAQGYWTGPSTHPLTQLITQCQNRVVLSDCIHDKDTDMTWSYSWQQIPTAQHLDDDDNRLSTPGGDNVVSYLENRNLSLQLLKIIEQYNLNKWLTTNSYWPKLIIDNVFGYQIQKILEELIPSSIEEQINILLKLEDIHCLRGMTTPTNSSTLFRHKLERPNQYLSHYGSSYQVELTSRTVLKGQSNAVNKKLQGLYHNYFLAQQIDEEDNNDI